MKIIFEGTIEEVRNSMIEFLGMGESNDQSQHSYVYSKNLAQNLTTIRRSLCMDEDAFGYLLGYPNHSARIVQRYESGDNVRFLEHSIKNLAYRLGIPYDILVNGVVAAHAIRYPSTNS